jgi:WD40 repeat protein/tetratricopeptide (TPR) repeat protein
MPLHFTCPQGHQWELPTVAFGLPAICPTCGTAADRLAPEAAPPGTIALPGYQILGEIGHSPLGTVWKALQLSSHRLVAVKVLREGLVRDEHDLVRFRKDAERVAGLPLPYTVPLLAAGDAGGRAYLTFELVEGANLAHRIHGTPLPAQQAAAVAEKLARTLHAAHQFGVIHQDVKPANVLFGSDGVPRLTDFPLPCLEERLSPSDRATPAYLAPEQVDDARGDLGPATDIHALGAVLYEMLTGRPPFRGDSAEQTRQQVLAAEPVRPHVLEPTVPPDLESICLKCLHKDSRQRYPNAEALGEDLRRYLAGQSPRCHAGPVERAWDWCRQNLVAAALAAVAAALLVALPLVTSVLTGRISQERQQAQAERARAEAREKEILDLTDEARQDRAQADRDVRQAAELREAAIRTRDDAVKERDGFRKQMEQAFQDRLAEGKKRRDAEEAREEAKREAAQAEAARAIEARKREQAEEGVGRLYATQGGRLLDEGDLFGSLSWYAAALQKVQGNAKAEQLYRLRLATVQGQCPRLVQLWYHEQPLTHLDFSRDGSEVLTVAQSASDGNEKTRTVRVWGSHTGQLLGKDLPHPAAVTHAQLSPDGQHVATAAADRAVRIFEVKSGKLVSPPLEHEGTVTAVQFTPDSKRLLTASSEGEVQMWDVATGKALGEGLELMVPVAALLSPDGRQILTATPDGTVQLYDAESYKPAGKPLSHSETLTHLQFSPDGRRLLTASANKRARVWDLTTSALVGSIMETGDTITHAAFSPDGRLVLTVAQSASDGNRGNRLAQTWDAVTGKPLGRAPEHAGPIRQASFSPDGRLVVTADANAVQLWEARTGKRVGPLLRHREPFSHARFSPDGRHLATATEDGSVRAWDTATGEPLAPTLKHNGRIVYLGFGPEGHRLLTATGQTARLWDLATAALLDPVRTAGDLGPSWAFSPDGKYRLRISGDTVQVLSNTSDKPVGAPLKHPGSVVYATFSPDGGRVVTLCNKKAVADRTEAEARIWNAESGAPITEAMELRGPGTSASFSADGKRLLTLINKPEEGHDEGEAQVWDALTGKVVSKPMMHQQRVKQALFSPKGDKVLTIAIDRAAYVWESATGKQLTRPLNHNGDVLSATFDAKGEKVVTTSEDGTAKLWDIDRNQPIGQPLKHQARVVQAAFSGDGERVATASSDRTARVWDTAKGEPVTPPLKHGGVVTAVAFSPDGRWLVTAGDNLVRVWDAVTGEPLVPPLKHGQLGGGKYPLTYAAVTGKGRIVVGNGYPGDPKGRRTWDLGSSDRPVTDLVTLVRLLDGQRVDSAGTLMPLTEAELRDAWRELRPRYASDFVTPDHLALAWARWGADDCERVKNWSGALRHLDWLTSGGAVGWELRARRARLQAELGQWAEAVAEYSEALKAKPESSDLWLRRGQARAQLGQWKEAVADYSRAVELKTADRNIWSLRGRAYAELGQWAEAAGDLDRAAGIDRDNPQAWQRHALALLASNNLGQYRPLCVNMSKRFRGSTNPQALYTLARTCVLAPDALTDLRPLIQALEREGSDSALEAGRRLALGALLYRSGKFEEAAGLFQQALKSPGDGGLAVARFFLAMTHQRLGQTDEAKKQLEAAVQWLDQANRKKPGEAGSLSWDRRLELQLLRKEAAGLIQEAKGP